MAELRGRSRHQVARELAACFRRNPGPIVALAHQVGRPPRQVRRLLTEAGVSTRDTTCLGMPETDLATALAHRYHHGASISQLRHDTGLTRRDIQRLVRGRGVQLRTHHSLPADRVAWAVQQYNNGVSLRGLATQTGTSYGAVRNALLAHGVTLRKPTRADPRATEK